MKIVLIGATGYVGSFILDEALNRNHQVTAISRHPEELTKHANLVSRKGDIFNIEELANLMSGHEAVISAFSPGTPSVDPADIELHAQGTIAIINAVKKTGVMRLLMVGGAGSLEVAPGQQLVDTPDFPAVWKYDALAAREALYILKKEQTLAWSFLSPSALLQPGERTGKFRLGTDQLIRDSCGESKISNQDYAVAMIDELENQRHTQKRFTVGY